MTGPRHKESGASFLLADDLKCRGRELEFTELPLGRNAPKIIEELIMVCLTCRHIKPCYEKAKREGARDVIQGGQQW